MALTSLIWGLPPPLPMGPGALFQLSVGLSVPAWPVLEQCQSLTCLWPCLLDAHGPTLRAACLLDGPCGHVAACFQSCLWPCPLDELQTHVIALSLVLPPAPSPLAPDESPWTVPGPGSSLSLSGAVDEACYGPQLCPPWSDTRTSEGMACTGVTLGTHLILP